MPDLIDVGEITEITYQPGRYSLGAFAGPDTVSVSVAAERRPVFLLPGAIVQRAEMVTALSNQGKSQTAARFLLAAAQQPFLRIELPEGATLWSVQLDGQPAKPQRRGEELLISLTGGDNGPAWASKLRDLQLVFESPVNRFNFVGSVDAQAPKLWLVGADEGVEEAGLRVPLVDLNWRLMLPDGFTVTQTDGNFQSGQLVQRQTLAARLGDWFYWLGGGVGRVQMVREAARRPYAAVAAEPSPSFEIIENAKQNAQVQNKGEGAQVPYGDEEEMDAMDIAGAPATPEAQKKKVKEAETRRWALSGLRSLDIELTDTGNSIDFYNLGEQSTLNATIVNQSRLNWLALAVSLLLAAFGVLLTHGRLDVKLFFLINILLVAAVAPLVAGVDDVFRSVLEMGLLAAVFVAIYFILASLLGPLVRPAPARAARASMVARTLFIGFVCSLSFCSTGQAQEIINFDDDLKRLVGALQPDGNVTLPTDAIIIPFDVDDPRGREKADRLLLPYEHYLKLLKQSEAEQTVEKLNSPVDFMISSAAYELQLDLEEDVEIRGKLTIDVLTDNPVSIALPLEGGALANATVDGRPARLQFVEAKNPKPTKQTNQWLKKVRDSSQIVQLYLDGRGTKTFEFTVQLKPERLGGWRQLNMRLPVGVTRGLKLKSIDSDAEIRLNHDAQQSIDAEPNQEIATILSAEGRLRLQWKPESAQVAIDQSLTAKSEAVFDIREDGLRLSWLVGLDFRGSERDMFELQVPAGFLVENVSGENIRSWELKDDQADRLSVTLLSPAKDQESFSIELSKRDFSITDEVTEIDAPALTVVGAALQNGVYTIRRSPIIDLKTGNLRAANRVDESQVECRINIAEIDTNSSPLGIETFQKFQFLTTPFQIALKANLIPRTMTADLKSILRIGKSESNLESKINVTVGKRPIYDLVLNLPADAKVGRLSAGLNESWSAKVVNDGQQIQIAFPAGVANDFAIVFEAELTQFAGGDELQIPKISVDGARKQSGAIAIQLDPAIAVTTSELENCETISLKQVGRWLKSNQKAVTRLAVRTRGSDYSGLLRFTEIEPRVNVETVTNVRTTLFAIEETLLLDFDIQQAGIRTIEFELPVEMRNSRINAKLVRQTLFEDVEDNPNAVRVTLVLQDDVIDSYRVVIENDRPLSAATQKIPVPIVLTGTTRGRFVTLQNAGRDEIEVPPSDDFVLLNRNLSQFSKLKRKLAGGELTMAYVANAEVDAPELNFETKQREVFDTVAASIEFSKTTMNVDSSGAYRALQNFQVNNRSEQYLEIELPEGARLLTVVVEGQPVKPVAWPAAQNKRRLRIPLVKTPAGDLDYPVQLKYAGQLGKLKNFREVSFPVIETLNINVQLSQLHLRLPASHRWMRFDGTMTKVDSRGELEESYLGYKSRQIQQLAEQLRSEASSLSSSSQRRAFSNMKRLKQEMLDYESDLAGGRGVEGSYESAQQLQQIINVNNDAIDRAQQDYGINLSKQSGQQVDNRANFNQLVREQDAKLSSNSVNRNGQNFFDSDSDGIGQNEGGLGNDGRYDDKFGEQAAGADASGQAGKEAVQGKFDSKWLSRNNLDNGSQTGTAYGKNAQLQQQEVSAGRSVASNSEGQAAANPSTMTPQSYDFVVPNQGRAIDNSIGFQNSEKLKMNEAGQRRGRNKGGGGMGGGGGGVFGPDLSDDTDPLYQGAFKETEVDGADTNLLARPDLQVGGYSGLPPALKPQSGSMPLGDRVVLGKDAEVGDSEGYLTSLEIELPARGVDYYFSSPRGNASVTVRPLVSKTFANLTSAMILIGVSLGVWIVVLIGQRIERSKILRMSAVVGLALAGLISVLTSTLPIYGLLAIVAAIALAIREIGYSQQQSLATE